MLDEKLKRYQFNTISELSSIKHLASLCIGVALRT